jgi:hypothetical protein
MFAAIVLLHPEAPGGAPPSCLHRLHRTLPAACRSLSLALGRRSRMRAPSSWAAGIVDPDGRVFSLRGAQNIMRGRTLPTFTVEPVIADALRVAAGFMARGEVGWEPSWPIPRATPSPSSENPA